MALDEEPVWIALRVVFEIDHLLLPCPGEFVLEGIKKR